MPHKERKSGGRGSVKKLKGGGAIVRTSKNKGVAIIPVSKTSMRKKKK